MTARSRLLPGLVLLVTVLLMPAMAGAEEPSQVTPTPFGMLMQTAYDGHLRIVLDFGEELTTDLTGSVFEMETPKGKVGIRLLPEGALGLTGSDRVFPKDLAAHRFWNLSNGKLRVELPWTLVSVVKGAFMPLTFVPSQPLEI